MKKMTRRGFLCRATSAMACVAQPVSAQNTSLQAYITPAIDAFTTVLQKRTISRQLQTYLIGTSANNSAFPQDRINTVGILETLASIQSKQFYRLSETDQLHAIKCATTQAGQVLQFLHRQAQSGGVKWEIDGTAQAYNQLRQSNARLDPLFKGVNETCNSVYTRTIARLNR